MTKKKPPGRPMVCDEKITGTSFRLTQGQRIKVRKLGGSKWIREQIDKATPNETNVQPRMAGKSDVPLVDETASR